MAKKYNCTINGVQYFKKSKVIGHDINGKPLRKYFYGDGEKDADRQIEEFMNKLKSGLNVNIEALTVEQAMHQWLFDVRLHSKKIKSASFEKDECNYRNYIKGTTIGSMCVQNAVSLPFQRYYNELYTKGRKVYNEKTKQFEYKEVSSNKIFDINKTLRAFFTYCIKEHYTLNNPCTLSNIEIPGNADGEEDDTDEEEGNNIQAFNDTELQTIIDNLKYKPNQDNTFKVMLLLDIVTGLRSGELRGLKKKFVEQNIVKIRNTLKRIKVFETPSKYHYETKLIKPKSDSSIRNVNFPTDFSLIMEQYLQEQELKWKNNGLKFDEDSLIFTTKNCTPIEVSNFRRAWQRFLKRVNIEYKKFHSIRDTYATKLIRLGANITTVKELLGHSSITITEKYYVFVFPEDRAETANLLNNLILPETHNNISLENNLPKEVYMFPMQVYYKLLQFFLTN